MHRILLAVLTAVMMAGELIGCAFGPSMEDIAGKWERTADDTPEQAMVLLESIDFYGEEIACVDLNALDYVHTVEFSADGTYRFAVDAAGTKNCVKAFYRGVFEDLYGNRGSLDGIYDMKLSVLTQEEFNLFYAGLYGCEDFETFLNVITENAYHYEGFAEPTETGRYRIAGGMLYCTITGDSREESLGFRLEEDELTLTFADATQVFYRAG